MLQIGESSTSLYVHWPFCKAKCPYCDFNSHVRDTPLEENAWQLAYLQELEHYRDFLHGKTITSIYFGGGTPTLMPPILVEKIIDRLSGLATVPKNLEITLEGNPTSVETNKLVGFKKAGVNRVSLGIQALDNDALKFLGREHSAREALNAIEAAASLFERYTFDLIYARPEQTLKAWESELNEAMRYIKSHASLYQLTIEKGTPFYSRHQKGEFQIPDEELAADMYELTNEMLAAKGLVAYEVSNYAIAGHESRHNLNYWRYGDYVGIGAGAHGRVSDTKGRKATITIHQPENWLKQVHEKGHGLQQETLLNANEMLEEFLMFGLRLKEGINLNNAKEKLGAPLQSLINQSKCNLLESEGLLRQTKTHLQLSEKGRMLINSVIGALLS